MKNTYERDRLDMAVARLDEAAGAPSARIGFALLMSVLTIVFLYLSLPLELSGNGLHYILDAQHATFSDPSFYPPHLLLVPMIGFFHLALSTGSACDVACAAMAHSMFWAAVTVVAVFITARVLIDSTLGAVATALMVLVAHGFWVFATQGEAYVPTVGCLTAAMALLLTNQSPTLGVKRTIAIAALWALATMYHLASVVFMVPLCAYIFATQGWRGWLPLGIVCGLAGTTVVAMFTAAYLMSTSLPVSFAGFLDWVLEISDRPLTDWGSVSNVVDLRDLVRGMWSQIAALTVLPDYLALDLDSPWDQLPLGIVGGVTIAAVLLWNAIQVARRTDTAWARLFLLLLFSTEFLLFVWWDSAVHKFFIPSSIAIILLAALALRDLWRTAKGTLARRLLGVGVASLITLAFVFNISSVVELKRSFGPYHAEAEVLNRLAPKDCYIYSVGNHNGPLLYYFSRNNTVFAPLLGREFFLIATGEVAPEPRVYAGERCSFIALGWLSPGLFELRIRPYVKTAEWRDYVGYVLDAHPAAAGGGISYNPFELRWENGVPYLLIDRERRVEVASIDLVTDQLLAAQTEALAGLGEANTLENWVFLAVPRTDLKINRMRDRIFGYAWGDFARRRQWKPASAVNP